MKKMLIIGLCYADAQSLKKVLEKNFQANTMDVTRSEEAKNILRQRKIDLIMVSRVLVGDKSSGIEFLAYVKKNHPEIPIIILTRFPEAQKEALEKGAVGAFDLDLFIGYIRPSMEEKRKESIQIIEKWLR
jgi:two-component SAPR family response regulator